MSPTTRPAGKSRFVALAAALLGAAIWYVASLDDRRLAASAYLAAWLYLLSITLGSQVLLWLHNLTGGAWGRTARPGLEAAASLLPLVGLAFVPIAFEVRTIYVWAALEGVTSDPILVHKRPWLNVEAFRIRAALYFGLWIIAGFLVRRAERRAADDPSESAARRVRVRSGQAIGLYGLSMTFASVDWAMSLNPHWYSAAYGVIFVIGQGLSALAFQTLVAARLSATGLSAGLGATGGAGALKNRELDSEAHQSLTHHPTSQRQAADPHPHDNDHHATPLQDLGNLLLAFTMLWAYVSFSQFLIIWFGDLPEEVVWYLQRLHGGWQVAAWSLLLFHFALPFFALMQRHTKRDPRAVGTVAAGMLAMRSIDLVWHVAPEFGPASLRVVAANLGAILLVGGIGYGLFDALMRRRGAGYSAPVAVGRMAQ